MNIQQFFEEEIIDFSIDFGHAKNCDVQPPNDGEQMCSCGYEQLESAVKNMNIRLINKVLDEVKREVEKQKRDNVFVPDHTPSMHGGIVCKSCGGHEDCFCSVYNEFIEEISTIIDQLKLK